MKPTDFCPACGTPTVTRWIEDRERAVCPACDHVMYLDPKAAAITFIEEGDRVLLVQRKFDPGIGKWGLPGGFIEYGEDPRDTARREALEETGLTVEITGLLDVFYVENGVITIAYAGRRLSGEAQALDDAAAVGWFTRDDLPELVFLSTVTLCQRWQQGTLTPRQT